VEGSTRVVCGRHGQEMMRSASERARSERRGKWSDRKVVGGLVHVGGTEMETHTQAESSNPPLPCDFI